MSASSLIVTLNALRMRRVGDYEGPSHPGQFERIKKGKAVK
jgi:hypothetical protein